jgi:hypothetical protein
VRHGLASYFLLEGLLDGCEESTYLTAIFGWAKSAVALSNRQLAEITIRPRLSVFGPPEYLISGVIYEAEPAAPAARASSIALVVRTLIAYRKRTKPRAAPTK